MSFMMGREETLWPTVGRRHCGLLGTLAETHPFEFGCSIIVRIIHVCGRAGVGILALAHIYCVENMVWIEDGIVHTCVYILCMHGPAVDCTSLHSWLQGSFAPLTRASLRTEREGRRIPRSSTSLRSPSNLLSLRWSPDCRQRQSLSVPKGRDSTPLTRRPSEATAPDTPNRSNVQKQS